MALWAGSAINSTETAMVFNQLWNGGKAIAMVRKKNGALYAILGKKEQGATPGTASFERMKKITGAKVEVKLLGKLKSIATVADGSAEMATATLVNDGDYWGAMEFPLAHYKDAHGLPESEIMRYKGQELKTANYIDEVFKMLTLSLENTWGTALHATGSSKGASRTVLQSLQHSISDGTTATETQSSYVTYGTLTRSDSANADACSVVTVCGNLDLTKIQTMQNSIIANGGNPTLAVAHTTYYTKVQQLIQPYSKVEYTEDWAKYGNPYVVFSGIRFTLDQRCSSTDMLFLDPESWVWYQQDIDFTESGVVKDPSRVAAYVLNWGSWVQCICTCPSHQGKLVGIAS